MPETPSTGQEIQSEILDMVRKSQEALIAAIKFWADAVQSITSFIRTPNLPYSDKLPKPEELVVNAYDFAEQLLTSQRKCAENVIEATRPLLGARKARRPRRATPSSTPHVRRTGIPARRTFAS